MSEYFRPEVVLRSYIHPFQLVMDRFWRSSSENDLLPPYFPIKFALGSNNNILLVSDKIGSEALLSSIQSKQPNISIVLTPNLLKSIDLPQRGLDNYHRMAESFVQEGNVIMDNEIVQAKLDSMGITMDDGFALVVNCGGNIPFDYDFGKSAMTRLQSQTDLYINWLSETLENTERGGVYIF